jgi:glucan biosynthesis protein C
MDHFERSSVGAARSTQREHHWDALRAFLMLLGIPYHTAIAYRPAQQWIVRADEGDSIFTYLTEVIHLFRMPAFFLIAGYFAGMLLTRRAPKAWLQGRFQRLGIPFLICIMTLVPMMNLVCELSNLPFAEAIASWRDNSLKSGGYWIRHLWFIIVLLYCSIASAGLVWWFPQLRLAKFPEWLDNRIACNLPFCLLILITALGLWEAAAIEAFYKAGLATNLLQEILRLNELIEYSPYFIIGFCVSRAPETLERLGQFSRPIVAIAVVSALVFLFFLDDFSPPAGRFAATVCAITITQTLIAVARMMACRPVPAIQRLTTASLVIYLFHMPIVVVLIALGQYVAIPVIPKAFGIMALTLLLSYGAWEIIERSDLLSFLFNGNPLAKPREGLA